MEIDLSIDNPAEIMNQFNKYRKKYGNNKLKREVKKYINSNKKVSPSAFLVIAFMARIEG